MEAIDKIKRAKIQLVLNEPFFANLALRMEYIEEPEVMTCATDGSVILYAPKFIESLQQDMVMGLLAHEVMHVAMMHPLRLGDRNPDKWNIACDYAINGILTKSGIKLPDGGCYDPQFDNMSAEKIYSLIPDPPPQGGQDDGDGQGISE